MRCTWILIACGLIMHVAAQTTADEVFDSYGCKSECAFRYGIQRDYGGNIKMPSDSLRWEGYQKCVDECDRKSSETMFGPGGD